MKKLYFFVFCFLFSELLYSQINLTDKIALSGSLQTDILLPREDASINAAKDHWIQSNTYLNVSLQSKYITAGTRFEYMKHPLPGFEADFAGYGISNVYITGIYKNTRLTIGDFYDQFGNGLIFRTYEERSLGIDNSLRGARFVYQPFKGANIKLLGGRQRRYFEWNDSFVWGGDMELNISEWSKKMQESATYLTLGTSFVSKHEKEEDILVGLDKKLNLPENIGAFAGRLKLQKGNYSFTTEYAWKANDPSFDNGYIYKNGSALLLSGSYSKSGMSVLLQAKRSENMAFKSKRSVTGTSLFINHLPAFTNLQTYALTTIYPYATQIAGGEWAFQGELGYLFKRKTTLGGKYGTKVKLNFSHIRSIDKEPVEANQGVAAADAFKGTNGYTSAFFKLGNELYYQDITWNIDKRATRDFSFNLLYTNLFHNQFVVEGHGDAVRANIFVGEGKYQISKKASLRSELQYLQTRDDLGDWMAALVELSVAPNFSFSVSDMYNSGETNIHYY
ncbi:MAG: DUF6029 family protein, partial [Prevotellaceae bacterium]|nr:DUF6029 family protein [Prevotellaceae bacterium]